MKKIVKILVILFILFFILNFFNHIYAADVNMNLSNDSSTYGSNTNKNTVNNAQSSSVLVSSTPTTSLDELSMSDMINIILCAIGFVLILLGISFKRLLRKLLF